ncbi:hypothetical protein B0T10DRAFT_431395 [Thelonectria olida]|uniref:G-patch domain-containing protein n=1 Tax=Thelonectria olida TaxID=1576542 RepID=A0A9P8WMM9_9HYPO|nr:hypothetical protein B0T10DRAFT_431395 [Thelonectria olida]
MSYKRSRTTYEADLHAPYAAFGTPLPDDSETRDDGSYLPLWKQEVRDERGRKRLHGAFTGGWSAGYFNTVGSKEGWTPSTFVSSRTNRHRDNTKSNQEHRPEDYMDEEDLADAAESQKLQTSQAFAGLGSSTHERIDGGRMGVFKVEGDTMGLKLLRTMGWKDGRGIGPKVRRSARLGLAAPSSGAGETHLFAPDNTEMIQFVRKVDRKGLGYDGETKLSGLRNSSTLRAAEEEEEEEEEDLLSGSQRGTAVNPPSKKKSASRSGGIGVGILNDTGSDEEDPYEIGPKIRYNRVIGGDKKKKKTKKASATVNPTLRNAPVFLSKTARAGNSLARCHDGRLPLDGFVLAKVVEDLTDLFLQYAPPPVPPGWVSSKKPSDEAHPSEYLSTADAAKASTHDAKSRAALLGEKSLPGKSVFDFLSSSARDRLATGSGKKNLPPGLGEVPEGFAMSEEEKQQSLWDQAPQLDRETAVATIARGSSGPYADDEAKKARYRTYLEHFATGRQPLPYKPKAMTDDEFLRELGEFHNCARIFKPMTGFMASRFTTAKKASPISTDGPAGAELFSKPEPKPSDPAEEAAKVGMYGKLTRTVEDFFPTRLLCKRFNVKAPAHSRPDNEPDNGSSSKANEAGPTRVDRDAEMRPVSRPMSGEMKAIESGPTAITVFATAEPETSVNPEKNEAVEGKAAHEEVLRAIFGDSDTVTTPSSLNHLRFALFYAPTLSLSVFVWSPIPFTPVSPRTGEAPPLLPPPLLDVFSLGIDPSSRCLFEKKTPSTTSSSAASSIRTLPIHHLDSNDPDTHILLCRDQSPPPQYPASEASSSHPPPFSSLFSPPEHAPERTGKFPVVVVEGEASGSTAAPAYESAPREDHAFDPDQSTRAFRDPVAETKRALPRDTKGETSRKDDDAEPPPAYSEGDSPLLSFSYLMAAAGGASSIITQVQQGGPPPVNTLGDVGADETIALDLRGTRFYLSRDELLTLPEFVLLSLFPNGLFPEGRAGGFQDGDVVQVDYDPASLQYMLDFFRGVAESIPTETDSQPEEEVIPLGGGGRDDAKRAGIIVLREDLDFYAIPPRPDIDQVNMIEVKRAAAQALQQQDGIFSGLKRSDEPGTTEAHLIEMLTAGGFNHDDTWGHRAGEPNKAVICSLALARLRTDIRGTEMTSGAMGMAQKLLLFWRKPARRCWWEGVELDNVQGVEGKLKVWIRRVWTLEMSVIGLR